MPSARDRLRRFRPVTAPGAASARGVPADRIAERDAELAPIFALLEAVENETARVRRLAEADAAARVSAARGGAEAILAAGARRATAERAAAAAELTRRTREDGAAGVAAGRREAEQVSRVAAERLPDLVDAATTGMRTRLGAALTDGGASRKPASAAAPSCSAPDPPRSTADQDAP